MMVNLEVDGYTKTLNHQSIFLKFFLPSLAIGATAEELPKVSSKNDR